MGIREVDLEPQFEGGRILIPRISEYAGVILVQALRAADVEMTLGPSDQIFSTPETLQDRDDSLRAYETSVVSSDELTEELAHPAEDLPVTSGPTLPNVGKIRVIDVIMVSATLKTQIVQAERSTQYQEVLEALQREMKYKAHRKGATGIVHFTISLTHLSLPTHYRLQLTGTAIAALSV